MSAPSARGLFRATGKTSKPVHVRDLVSGEIVKVDSIAREKDDFYRTPPAARLAVLDVEGERIREFEPVWEPACGDGAIVGELESLGFDVYASDIVPRGFPCEIRSFYDFGIEPHDAPSTAIVTNPPFAECSAGRSNARWLWHALDNLGTEYMALLLPWSWPGAAGIDGLWHKHPPVRIYLMTWRLDFTGQGAQPALFGWYVWDRRAANLEPVYLRLGRVDARQSDLIERLRP